MSRADRLNALVAAVAAKAPQCAYQIKTLADGAKQILLTCDDGDVVAGMGENTEKALAHLESKIAARLEK